MFKIALHPIYHHPLPENHRFPMEKYSLLPQQLLHEGTVSELNFFKPKVVSEAIVLETHTRPYWHKLTTQQLSKQEVRKIGFPQSQQLIERELTLVGGTVACAEFALEYGCAMNIAGGTHHAFTDRGEGFCLLNDNAIAANYLLKQGLATQILIIDLDVHQGNGTAEIFQENPNVFTFCMHGKMNYPFHKERSDLDIPLEEGIKDRDYLYFLEQGLENISQQFTPDFVFYQCGVDVLETDKLGRLSLTQKGCKQRDEVILKFAKQQKIPLAASMGGGYSPDIKQIIEAHANTFRLAQAIFF